MATRSSAWIVLLLLPMGCGTSGSGVDRALDATHEVGREVVGGLTAGLPGLSWTARVGAVTERAGTLDVRLEGEHEPPRLLFPPSDRCRGILLEVGYDHVVRLGPAGNNLPVPLD